MQIILLLLIFLSNFTLALTVDPQPDSVAWHHLEKRDSTAITEWTALGDSYASGIGAGKYDQFRRCFRFDHAYPRLMQATERLAGDPKKRKLNNAACSGATAPEVLAEQYRDTDGSDLMYGFRPAFGKPQFATLSFGGNDIDLKGIVLNCVYEPFKYRNCDDQTDLSWKLLRGDELASNMDKVIKTTIDKGRAATGESFKLYVIGYPDFFNDQSTQCDTVSWSVAFNWYGEHLKMDKTLRTHFNDMSNHLNNLLDNAVNKRQDQGVRFINWNANKAMMANHRYCEEGVTEPTKDRADTWFFEWKDAAPMVANNLNDKLAQKLDPSISSFSAYAKKYPSYDSKIDTPTLLENAFAVASDNGTVEADNWFINTVRVFHPKADLHQKIADMVLDSVVNDFGRATAPATTPPPAADICGDWYKVLFDHFEIYGKNFNAGKFGQDGSGLKKQIEGCGDLTKWHFEPRINDPQGYQWFAKGNLPIGTKACIGRAVVSAGGASADGCTGAG